MPSRRPFGPPSARQKNVVLKDHLIRTTKTFAAGAYVVDGGLADVECAEQKSVDAEEDVVGVDGVDPIGVGL